MIHFLLIIAGFILGVIVQRAITRSKTIERELDKIMHDKASKTPAEWSDFHEQNKIWDERNGG
jgi:hypothetical protein